MLKQHARKGRPVYVAGRMQTRRWRGDGENSDRFSTGSRSSPVAGSNFWTRRTTPTARLRRTPGCPRTVCRRAALEKPARACLQLEDQQANSEIGAVFAADPAVVGALRMDPGSTDDACRRAGKAALAADVDDALWTTVLHLLTPDAPRCLERDPAGSPSPDGFHYLTVR